MFSTQKTQIQPWSGNYNLTCHAVQLREKKKNLTKLLKDNIGENLDDLVFG